nr:uncharacterized protein LOC112282155 isoform X1 [Physcomitrium patens]|eukprot:XP_024375216.1 uncharacterized protein LOC112282155 isoform X1 [Physcomitrella patens]
MVWCLFLVTRWPNSVSVAMNRVHCRAFSVCVCVCLCLILRFCDHFELADGRVLIGDRLCAKKLNTKYIGTETWYLCSNMGIFRTSFSFSLGAFTGVYIAQNYTIPNLKTFITTGLIVAKQLETQYRKPSKGEDD